MFDLMLLHQLPEELLQDILDRLEEPHLRRFNLASRWCYEKAAPLLWREVTLVDCRAEKEGSTLKDEHDDTPLIRKLLLLATRPDLASHVQVVTHRCHLPPPAIFNELPRSTFSSQTLSIDPRTIWLAQLAVRHMTKVNTLRIVFGHPSLNDALLRCFFDKSRSKTSPVRKLWLECCRVSVGLNAHLREHPYGLPLELDFTGLESIRFRRLPLRPGEPLAGAMPLYHSVHARSNILWEMQDGMGGQYITTAHDLRREQLVGEEHWNWSVAEENPSLIEEGVYHDETSPLQRMLRFANTWDDEIYSKIEGGMTAEELSLVNERHVPSHLKRAELAHRGTWLDPLDLEPLSAAHQWKRAQREKIPSSQAALHMLANASQTITSLTIDWIFTMPSNLGYSRDPIGQQRWVDLYIDLFSLRFPHLRAFQFRNAVVFETQLPHGMYLFDRSYLHQRESLPGQPDDAFTLRQDQLEKLDTLCLSFIESHQSLQCLAWPMDHFFSESGPPSDLVDRVDATIENLSRSLVDLRVDTLYSGVCDLQTESHRSPDAGARERRRRFIEYFAAKMKKVESIKVEGGMPRDERRETLRALHACPLRKIVLIGICSPLGNTWGHEGRDLAEQLSQDELEALEGEHKDAIWKHGTSRPEHPPPDYQFVASYEWPPGPPMIHTIASLHADTVTELKFCGYKGSPVLLSPTPVTTPMLSALKHFHKLESFVFSMWLSTVFEGAPRDAEIISYWLQSRSPSSTALVRVTDEEPQGWEKELLTKYAPAALARRITSFIGPYLSEQAKGKRAGVHVRASFCIGDWGGIFDVDLRIGKDGQGNDVCLSHQGPREEHEAGRRKSKLDSRRWF